MIEKIDEKKFGKAYVKFRRTKKYEERGHQKAFLEIAQSILKELIKKNTISNIHLTGLIQMFKAGCKKETFGEYLNKFDLPKNVTGIIQEKFLKLKNSGITGFTGQGRAAIKALSGEELNHVKNLLKSISEAKTSTQIKQIVDSFDSKNISQVKHGIYSPWIYYLQPAICPITAGSGRYFLSATGWDEKYSSAIELFEKLGDIIDEDEKDLGLIDAFLREVYAGHKGWQEILVDLNGSRSGIDEQSLLWVKDEYCPRLNTIHSRVPRFLASFTIFKASRT